MSRPSKPKPAVADAQKPAQPAGAEQGTASTTETQTEATPQVTPDPAAQVPDPTGAVTASAAAAAAPVDPKPAKATKARAVVTVKGPAKGRWRAGRHFGPEPVEIPLDDLSEEDVERLKADPELTVKLIIKVAD